MSFSSEFILQKGHPFPRFRRRQSGPSLDDLLLILERENQQTRLLTSVKSSLQLTKAGFNYEFAQAAWEEWDGSGTDKRFNPDRDLLGLIVGNLLL